MTDRRPTAADRRFDEFEDGDGGGRSSDRIGRVRLDEIDWEDANERRYPYEERIEQGSTPFPAQRGRKDMWDDWPEMPTQIDRWVFRPYTTENGYLAPCYVDRNSGGEWRRSIDEADTYVRLYDRREFGEGCKAYVVTPKVRVAAGSPPVPHIVQADDPDTFVRRLTADLEGRPPDEITHPRYDPSLDRNLPEGWVYQSLLPLETKTTYTWATTGLDAGSIDGYAIKAEGSTNTRMDVYAYPIPSLGENAPKTRPDELDMKVMPGPGPGPAAETARRMMRLINDDPDGFGVSQLGDDTPGAADGRERLHVLRSAEGERIDFYEGDLVKTVYDDNYADRYLTAAGRLRDVDLVDTTPDSTNDNEEMKFTLESTDNLIGDPGDTWEIIGRKVKLNGTTRGRVLRGNDPIYLVERAD